MTGAALREAWRAAGPNGWFALLGICVALSPANSKLAGASWLVICTAGAVAAWRNWRSLTPSSDTGVIDASRVWLICCAVAAALASMMALVWPDGPDTLHAEYRLLTAAAAVHVLLRGQHNAAAWRAYTLPALGLACVTALFKVALTPDRLFLPSNALPWAVAVTFVLCLLLPRLLDRAQPLAGRRWYGVAVALGVGAVLMSQSRGAYGVLVWCLWLAAVAWRRSHAQVRLRKVAVATSAMLILLGASAWHPADPLRLRMAVTEVTQAESQGHYNTSMGARIYLWSLGWKAFAESPLIGVGGAERLRRIHNAGLDLPAAQRGQLVVVRKVGHVHNQYLHAAMDGGLIGLAATLAVLVGLGWAALRLYRVDRVASLQLQGLLFMHATAGLTNVNMAHNYYAAMLSVAVALVLLGAKQAQHPLTSVADDSPATGR